MRPHCFILTEACSCGLELAYFAGKKYLKIDWSVILPLHWHIAPSNGALLPQPEIKEHLEFRFHLRSVLLDFLSLTEKPVFECAFAHPIMLFLSYLFKNSVDRFSVICKLATERYLMRMCAS